jgi:hypothetical protein
MHIQGSMEPAQGRTYVKAQGCVEIEGQDPAERAARGAQGARQGEGREDEVLPPQDLEEDMAGALGGAVKALNELVAKGLVKVDSDGNVEVMHG